MIGAAVRSLILRVMGQPGRPKPGEAHLYVSQLDRALHLVDDRGTDTALGAGGGGLTSPVAVADGGTGATTAATARSNLGIGTAGRCAVVPAQGISAATGYEVVTRQGGRYIRTKRRTTFDANRAIAAASPEYGWTWQNRARVTADEGTTTAGAMTWDNDATSTDWLSPTFTGPHRYRIFPWPEGRTYVITARISNNADATFEYGFISAVDGGANTPFARVGVGYQGAGGPHVGAQVAGFAAVTSAITTGQRDTGIWVRLIISRSRVELYYSTSSSSTPPTSWTYITGQSPISAGFSGGQIKLGQMAITVNTSDTLVCKWLYYDVAWMDDDDTLNDGMTGDLWPATQFDSSGTAQLLADDIDLGSDAPSVDNTRLRLILADLENRLQGDTATVTWAYKTSSTTGASAGTFRAAGSVVNDGAGGRYLRLWAKITSDGDTAGSIGPLPFSIPVS